MKRIKQTVSALAVTACAIFTSLNTNAAGTQQGGPCVCPQVYAPVCTYDGKEFSNACIAECNGYTADEYESCGLII
ncbi:Kazal-type serine protease inhibitor [Roseivirga sp. BDSF3-8]|uniref:Kazal-type serine protease inhibitor family protein n=1 Tax=Roseivirga sp. BDSF3-8 TaxID=3241598 RepID=UPI003531D45A